MITATDIRKAFVKLIQEKAQLPYKVHFNYISKSNESYVWVELQPRKINWDKVYFQWVINVDIQVILFPSNHAEIKHTDLWDISDALTRVIMPCLEIETIGNTRYITVQDANTYIVDDILHYEFALDFTDYVQSDEYEGLEYDLMENLEVKLNKETPQSVYFNEPSNYEPKEEERQKLLLDPSEFIQFLIENGGDD